MKKQMLTPKAQRDIERMWKLRHEAIQILGNVVAEWNSDPMSVQCFDLRMVERAKKVLDELNRIDTFGGRY